jgi:hypothetical protein
MLNYQRVSLVHRITPHITIRSRGRFSSRSTWKCGDMDGDGRMWEGDPMVNLWATVRRLALLSSGGFSRTERISGCWLYPPLKPHVHRYTRPVVFGKPPLHSNAKMHHGPMAEKKKEIRSVRSFSTSLRKQ